jgi:hypothetical protein
MAFNSDEDLILMTSEGHLYIIDILNERKKSSFKFPNFTDGVTKIEDA